MSEDVIGLALAKKQHFQEVFDRALRAGIPLTPKTINQPDDFLNRVTLLMDKNFQSARLEHLIYTESKTLHDDTFRHWTDCANFLHSKSLRKLEEYTPFIKNNKGKYLVLENVPEGEFYSTKLKHIKEKIDILAGTPPTLSDYVKDNWAISFQDIKQLCDDCEALFSSMNDDLIKGQQAKSEKWKQRKDNARLAVAALGGGGAAGGIIYFWEPILRVLGLS